MTCQRVLTTSYEAIERLRRVPMRVEHSGVGLQLAPFQISRGILKHLSTLILIDYPTTHIQFKKLLCDACGESFPHSMKLQAHVKSSCKPSQAPRFSCDVCRCGFKTSASFWDHVLASRLECDICGQRCAGTRSQFASHIATHTQGTAQPPTARAHRKW